MSSDNIVSDYVNEEDIPFSIELDDFDSRIPLYARFWEQLRLDKMAMFGGFVIIGFVLIAVFAPVLAPYSPEKATFGVMMPPLSSSHILGTDAFGHDILTRLIYGSRVSLIIAVSTVLIALIIGTIIGMLAGYYGGVVDTILMRYIDFQWAFPNLILAIGLIAFTNGTGMLNVVLALGIAYITDFARIVRGEFLSLREAEYVTAAKSIGVKNSRIMISEILPNTIAPIIVQMTFMIPLTIIISASLSFLGVGLDPSTPSWGLLISSGRNYVSQAWWISVMPGLTIVITVLGFNMFGDGLRDFFDISDTEVNR